MVIYGADSDQIVALGLKRKSGTQPPQARHQAGRIKLNVCITPPGNRGWRPAEWKQFIGGRTMVNIVATVR